MASERKFHNSIIGLQINGSWSQDSRLIKEVLNFYSKIYKDDFTYVPPLDGLDFDSISPLEADWLEMTFLEDEV